MCLGAFRSFSLAIEQPKSTWMFRLPQMIELFTQRKMQKYLTYLGYFDFLGIGILSFGRPFGHSKLRDALSQSQRGS